MQVIMIRHGEPDWLQSDVRKFIGHGRSLAPLTQKGIEQAREVAKNHLLNDSQIILSSPYTRALQTASYLAVETRLDLNVEVDLREWEPDLTYTFRTAAESASLYEDFEKCRGIYPQNETKKWESAEMASTRVINCLKPYAKLYQKIIVVTHNIVISQFVNEVPYCGMIDFVFDCAV